MKNIFETKYFFAARDALYADIKKSGQELQELERDRRTLTPSARAFIEAPNFPPEARVEMLCNIERDAYSYAIAIDNYSKLIKMATELTKATKATSPVRVHHCYKINSKTT